ncbi:RICIN domain-containing protein [Allokutzneria sp. NRRL B-24872]|uniref:RICIN domain-containing protein n=1 Tax=Allokutzneria sp. NRRL B-24872 TaxID=1137961 RepID=UPI000A398F93|nr:RICIN domain-containing protein [Allokutzneria sp. NRRL B-24872]
MRRRQHRTPKALLAVVTASVVTAALGAVPAHAADPPTVSDPGIGKIGVFETSGTKNVAKNSQNCLETFTTAANGDIWQIGQTAPGARWGTWTNLTGAAAGNPVVVKNADKRLEILVRGTDGAVRYTSQGTTGVTCGTKWETGGWKSLGTKITGDPAVALNPDGRVQLVARATDGTLVSRWQKTPGSAFTEQWDSAVGQLGTPTGTTIAMEPVVEANLQGKLQIFAVGADKKLWSRTQKTVNGVNDWTAWVDLGGEFAGVPAVGRNHDGRLQIFGRRANGQIWYSAQIKADGTTWGAWTSMGGVLKNDPVVISNSDGRLEIFAKAVSDGMIVHRIQGQPGSVDTWREFERLGDPGTDNQLIAARNMDGRVALITRQADARMSTRTQNAPSAPPGNDWSEWTSLSSGPSPCSGTGGMNCLSILNVASNLTIGPLDEAQTDTYYNLYPPNPAKESQNWKLESRGGGAFLFVNRAANRCMDVWGWTMRIYQETCSEGTNQNWYLEPVKLGSTYLIRRTSNGSCLAKIDKVAAVEVGTCNASDTKQHWRLGKNNGDAPGTGNLAIDHGLARCASDSGSCDFTLDGKVNNAYVDTVQCLPTTLSRNLAKINQTAVLNYTEMTGWQNTVGGSITGSVEFGPEVAKITAAITASYSHTWVEERAVSVGAYLVLKPNQYGWLEKGYLTKKVSGTWSFDGAHADWTVPGQSVMRAKEGTDQQYSAVTVFRTSMTPPTTC